MKYLKKFENHSQYESYIATDYAKPNVSYCVSENEVHYNPFSYADEYLTFVAKENGTFAFAPRNSNVISYSTDNGDTWTEGNTVSVNNGDKVMWKGTMTPTTSYPQGIGTFTSTGNFDVQGNAMSLLFGDNYKGQTDLTEKDYAFYSLFSGNTKIVNSENLSLPAETLASGCYSVMFYGCTSLMTTPELPATILANSCYGSMFGSCTSLTTAPELPATTLANNCYGSMFYKCTSLTTAPELSVTTLTDSCYSGMFSGCISLTTVPELPATTLTNSCYWSMFHGCTSLTTAPELPATTLASGCYGSMFEDCTNLTTAPELPVETLASGCYNNMFSGCTSLVTAPELPATTLAERCYKNMFRGCTNLTTAPELPASTLTQNCYYGMFSGCTNLNYIKAMFTTTPSTTYTENWVSGVSATGTFVKNSAAQWDVSGASGIPTGWTVETASE